MGAHASKARGEIEVDGHLRGAVLLAHDLNMQRALLNSELKGILPYAVGETCPQVS